MSLLSLIQWCMQENAKANTRCFVAFAAMEYKTGMSYLSLHPAIQELHMQGHFDYVCTGSGIEIISREV